MRKVAGEDDIPLGYFSLAGEFDPDDVTVRLGIQPTWVERIGDPGPPDALTPRLGATWNLSCKEQTSSDVADQIIALTYTLLPAAEQIRTLRDTLRATFYVFSSSGYADWFLTPRVLQDLASLQVDLACEHVLFPEIPTTERAIRVH